MSVSRSFERLVPLCLWFVACDPYARFGADGNHNGPVDPLNFPPANLGTGGDRTKPGAGVFTEIRAFAGGTEVGYFNYPSRPPGTAFDPVRLRTAGAPYAPVPVPPAYVFDPADSTPFPTRSPCEAPPGWTFNERVDDIHLDEQGNVFAALPRGTYAPGVAVSSSYVPVVSMVSLSAAGQACQARKSETQVLDQLGLATPDMAMASGRYVAFMIIEPAAAVFPRGMTAATHPGLGLQKWGWYGGYLLAYLDGGYVPTEDGMDTSMPPMPVTRMKTQRIYYPRSMVMSTSSTGAMTMAAGVLGAGYDVLEAKRGDPGYSPVCAVYTYDAGMPLPAGDLPRDAQTIEMMFNTMDAPVRPSTNPYVYCLQVR
jgi:hypothetical protein